MEGVGAVRGVGIMRVRVVFVVVSLLVLVGGGPAGALTKKALILYDPAAPGATTDANNMVRMLDALDWRVKSLVVRPGVAAGKLNDVIAAFFNTPAGNSDPKLLYYSGHGGSVVDDNGNPVDLPPVGESTGSPDDEHVLRVVDDDFPPLSGYAGPVVAIFDSCQSGGMFDGSDDFAVGNAALFASTGPDQVSSSDGARGSAFTVFLIRALMPGAADAAPDDGMITPDELHDYIVANWPPSWNWNGAVTPSFLESSVWKDAHFFEELPATFVPPPTAPPSTQGTKCDEMVVSDVPALTAPWVALLLTGLGVLAVCRRVMNLRPGR